MHEALEDIRRAGHIQLSDRSVMMLSLGFDEARKYIDLFKNVELKRTVLNWISIFLNIIFGSNNDF